MNKIFEFRKELNIKKIIIAILIFIVVVVIFTVLYLKLSSNNSANSNNLQNPIINSENPNSIFYSSNKVLSLELSKDYGFKQYKPSGNYLLELRNEKNLNIFISEEKVIENTTLFDVVSADIKAYIEGFNQYSNLSNITEFDRGGKPSYTYSFHYLDNNTKTAFYFQSMWIEYNNKYYIIDIEFPLNTLNENSKIINDILNSLIIK